MFLWVSLFTFLQIWIEPDKYGIEPGYQQKLFDAKQGLQLIVSADGRDGSLRIHQNASLYQLLLNTDESVSHTLEPGRTVYVHVVSGVISVNGERLNEGDGAEVKESDVVDFAGIDRTEALVFDLP